MIIVKIALSFISGSLSGYLGYILGFPLYINAIVGFIMFLVALGVFSDIDKRVKIDRTLEEWEKRKD